VQLSLKAGPQIMRIIESRDASIVLVVVLSFLGGHGGLD
jgi:hypothetical protein